MEGKSMVSPGGFIVPGTIVGQIHAKAEQEWQTQQLREAFFIGAVAGYAGRAVGLGDKTPACDAFRSGQIFGLTLRPHRCGECKGDGVVERTVYQSYESSGRDVEMLAECPDCEGTGIAPKDPAADPFEFLEREAAKLTVSGIQALREGTERILREHSVMVVTKRSELPENPGMPVLIVDERREL